MAKHWIVMIGDREPLAMRSPSAAKASEWVLATYGAQVTLCAPTSLGALLASGWTPETIGDTSGGAKEESGS